MARKNRAIAYLLLRAIKMLYRKPLTVLFVLIVVGGGYAYEVQIARPAQAFKGVPIATQWQHPFTWFRVFRNAHFMLGYSDIRGNPLWVSYSLKIPEKNSQHHKRPSHFKADWRSINKVQSKDYKGSGYDRGHMAPNYAISTLYGKPAQLNSFLMSNIVPQKPKLNQKLWQRLEEVEIKYFTQLKGKLWVITGPVFDGDIQRLKNGWNVEIPDAFYKIYVLDRAQDLPLALAFLMPQNVKGNESLNRYVVSIDEIEERTGLDFFSQLPDELDEKLEASTSSKEWQLKKVANIKSRY
jgi:endonuclease G